MKLSPYRIVATLAAAVVTTGAMCNKDAGSSSSAASSAPAAQTIAAPAVSSQQLGPGLPPDFPAAPGLTPCKPDTQGPLTMCKWKGVDGPSVYSFYKDALPKAGYSLPEGSKETKSPYDGEIGFQKGNVKGAMVISSTDVEIDFFISK